MIEEYATTDTCPSPIKLTHLRYASPAANDAHIATPPVQDLIKLFTTGDVLAGAPEVHVCPIIANKTSTPVPTIASAPAIVIAHFGYKPNTLAHALEGWKSVVEYVTKNEYWTRGYTVGEGKETDSVRTVEVYESWKFLDKVHVKSEAVARNQEQNGRDRTAVHGAVRVRAVDGFLGREERSRL
jgi:quinol monooxygenase YgiN